MLNPSRALRLNVAAGRPLPKVRALGPLAAGGIVPRRGEVIMIAGRPGAQKSGFALFWTAEMGLPTLYLSADMSPFQASARIASMQTGYTVASVESLMRVDLDEAVRIDQAVKDHAGHITFAFDSPITWEGLDAELEAWIELHNSYPEVIVFDNLMDIEGCSSGYLEQMEAMQAISDLSRATGATVFVLHHASDKAPRIKGRPELPPARDEIKGGMAEKPELTLGVALDPQTSHFNVACLKQRMGPQDPSGDTYISLQAKPELTRFGPLREGLRLGEDNA